MRERAKDKAIAELKINGQQYSVRATAHAIERMKERGVDEYVVAGTVVALGKERLTTLQAEQTEAIIIDAEKNVAVVIAFKGNKVQVVTVIDKAKVFVKKGTVIERL